MSRELNNDEQEKVEKEFKKFTETNYTDQDFQKAFDNEEKIVEKANKGALLKYAEYIPLFFSMLKDFFTKKYKEVPGGTIAAILGTILYIFSPIDIIPDVIPVIGLVDDAAVVALCLKFVSLDVEKYKAWKEKSAKLDKEYSED